MTVIVSAFFPALKAAAHINPTIAAGNRRARGGYLRSTGRCAPSRAAFVRRHCLTLFGSRQRKRKEHHVFKAKAQMILLVLVALALPMPAAADDQMPVKGSEAGTFQVLGTCGTNGIVIEVTGTGHSTQLGEYSGHYRECFVPATGAVTGGSFTLTAASGDTLFGTYGGQAVPMDDPSVVVYDDPGVITGGTGRFAGASGTANTSGVANLATGEYNGTISGSVSTHP
jgi:hypothetical protein